MEIELPEADCNYWVEPNIIGSRLNGETDYYLIYENYTFPYNFDGVDNYSPDTCIIDSSLYYAPENFVYFEHIAIFSMIFIFYILYVILLRRFIK